MVVDSSMLAKHTEQISINEVARLGGIVLEDKKQLEADEGQYLKGYRCNHQ